MQIEEFQILENLEYNSVIILKVIESSEILKEVFYEEIKTPIHTLYESALNDKLDEKINDYLIRFFNSLILTDIREIQKYKKVSDELQIPINILTDEQNVITDKIESEDNSDENIEEEVTVKKSGKPLKYPRRYGLEKVKEEIKKQGGEATLAQTAMIYSNSHKNEHVRVNNILIKDLHSEEEFISDADKLILISAFKIFTNKTRPILKKYGRISTK